MHVIKRNFENRSFSAGCFVIKGSNKICALLFLVISQFCSAQNIEDHQKWLLSGGFFITNTRVVDNKFSALIYSGLHPAANVSLKHESVKVSHELEGYFTKGTLKTSVDPVYALVNKYLNADYTFLYRINSADFDVFNFEAGASMNIMYAQRDFSNLINNNSSFEFLVSLSGTVRVSYNFKEKLSGFSLSNQLHVPFVSSIQQPAFSSEASNGNAVRLKNIFKSDAIGSFPTFLRLKNLLILQKGIDSHQRLSLTYIWDYYQIERVRKVHQANHRVGLSYGYIF